MDMTCITIDCANPEAVATFWNAALHWGGVATSSDGAVCGPAAGGLYLEFVRVPEGKIVKNRVHLGCSVASVDDLDAEIDRLEHLGASVAWEEEFAPAIARSYRNVVLRDIPFAACAPPAAAHSNLRRFSGRGVGKLTPVRVCSVPPAGFEPAAH